MINRHIFRGLAMASALACAAAAQAWEPTRDIEFIVPAGTGGGADQMARAVQAIVAKHGLAKVSIVTVNRSGGAGAEGFLEVKNAAGEPHKIIITLSNLFTTPLASKTPFNWRDLTPVQMLALDNFVLWVHASTPYRSARDYVEAARAAGPGKFRMGGTGSKQEDEIITVAIEQAAGVKFTYVPLRGGGAVAAQLAGKHVDSTVNNPIEAVAHWRAGTLRPLCVFELQRMPYKARVTADQSWADIPTCKEAGLDIDYMMLRGIFMPPGVRPEHVQYYNTLFARVFATPEWRALMERGAFNQTRHAGRMYTAWVEKEEARHLSLMKAAGFAAN